MSDLSQSTFEEGARVRLKRGPSRVGKVTRRVSRDFAALYDWDLTVSWDEGGWSWQADRELEAVR